MSKLQQPPTLQLDTGMLPHEQQVWERPPAQKHHACSWEQHFKEQLGAGNHAADDDGKEGAEQAHHPHHLVIALWGRQAVQGSNSLPSPKGQPHLTYTTPS